MKKRKKKREKKKANTNPKMEMPKYPRTLGSILFFLGLVGILCGYIFYMNGMPATEPHFTKSGNWASGDPVKPYSPQSVYLIIAAGFMTVGGMYSYLRAVVLSWRDERKTLVRV